MSSLKRNNIDNEVLYVVQKELKTGRCYCMPDCVLTNMSVLA